MKNMSSPSPGQVNCWFEALKLSMLSTQPPCDSSPSVALAVPGELLVRAFEVVDAQYAAHVLPPPLRVQDDVVLVTREILPGQVPRRRVRVVVRVPDALGRLLLTVERVE